MSFSEWRLEDEDNEPARGPTVGGQSSAASPAPSTAQVPTRPLMPREPMGIEEAALLRSCLRRWYYSPWIGVHQENRASYEELVMERSRQLDCSRKDLPHSRLGKALRCEREAAATGARAAPYVVGPSRRPAASLRDLRRWMAEASGEESGSASSRFAESPSEGRQQSRPR